MSTSPQVLDRYELQERLASSDIAEVWKAFDPQQKRRVAIKLLHVNLQTDPDFPTRFMREARRYAALRHPNIVRVRDFRLAQSSESESPETLAYIVMDYVEGQTLAEYIVSTSQQGKFPAPAEIARLFIPISLAIDYAHLQGIIHGDIKPTNILLDKTNTTINPMGQPILTDFGMAPILGGISLSTSFYTAPEQAQGHLDNERSDLYSLGIILYEMFTGVLPFQGENPGDTLMQQISATPPSPALINPNIRPAITAAILRSLAKDPAARFSSAAALVVALARAINMPVPENLSVAATPVDVLNVQTFLSPLPSVRPPGTTPSSPSYSGIGGTLPPPTGISPMPSAGTPVTRDATNQGSTINPGPMQGVAPSPGESSIRTMPMQSSGQYTPLAAMPDTHHSIHRGGELDTSATHGSLTDIPTQVSTQPPLSPPSPPATPRRRRRGLYIALIAALIVVLIGAGLGAFFLYFYHGAGSAQKPIAGYAFFVSSGLLADVNSSQGITDQLQINLQSIPDPQAGKSYYAWLLTDKNADFVPIFLGRLPVDHGSVNFSFPGTPQHLDLLATNSRFLITEEDASEIPSNPSLDPTTWRYYAGFSAVPNPADTVNHFSLLNHLRHLLAQDPKLKAAGLTGGLDIWLFRNTEKVLEWSGSAKDAWQSQNPVSAAFIHRQVIRILDYLDGGAFVQSELPPGTPLLVASTIARVSLLENVVNQNPPGYVFHIGKHLKEITESPGATQEQIALAVQINQAMDNVQFWLEQVHKDALQLVNMTDAQLLQPAALSILDDMATQANFAFTGQIDPSTNQVKPGVVQVHYSIQRLATFDITPCTMNGTSSTCAI